MRKILTVKPWVLFVLIFICGAWTSPSPLKEIINSIAVITFSLWNYAIGVYGQQRIAGLGLQPMNVKFFKFNVLFVLVFLLIILFFFNNTQSATSDNIDFKKIILMIGSFYLFFAIFQTIIFVCKTITTIELLREVSFGDYFTNLLLMFFFFIGVWILQPKVKRIFTNNKEVLQ